MDEFVRGMHSVHTGAIPRTLEEWNGRQFAETNGKDSGGLAVLMLVFPVVATLIALFIAAIPSAVVLLLICVALNPRSRVELWEAFVTAGFAITALAAVAMLLMAGLYLTGTEASPSSFGFRISWALSWILETLWTWNSDGNVGTTTPPPAAVIMALGIIAIPSLLAVARILRWRLPEDFPADGGWPKAILAAGLFAIFAPLAIAVPVMVYGDSYAPGESLGRLSITSYFAFGALTAAGIAFVVALPLARSVKVSAARARLAVALAIVTTLIGFLLFRGADEAVAGMLGTLPGWENRASFTAGLPGLLRISLPAILIAVLTVWLGRTWENRLLGFVRTVVVAGPICLTAAFIGLGVTLFAVMAT